MPGYWWFNDNGDFNCFLTDGRVQLTFLQVCHKVDKDYTHLTDIWICMFDEHGAVVGYVVTLIYNGIIKASVIGFTKINVPAIEFSPAGFVPPVGCIAHKEGNRQTAFSVEIADNSRYGWGYEWIIWWAIIARTLGNFDNQFYQLIR